MSKVPPAAGPTRRVLEVGPATVQHPLARAGSGPAARIPPRRVAFWATWDGSDFLDSLSERFTVYAPTVYAPTHPGFGESEGVEHIDDLLDLTLFHVDLLDELGLERPHLVGHFFGAMIAAEIAAIAGHRVDRLVLASPAGLWLDNDPGVDYFATPANELRSVLFHDPGLGHRATLDA